jgi:hypothetical protein
MYVGRQRLDKHVPPTTNARNNGRICGLVFNTVRVVSKESLWVCVSLLDNGLVYTFPRQRGIVTVSKESRRLVLLRTYCFILFMYLAIMQSLSCDVRSAVNAKVVA